MSAVSPDWLMTNIIEPGLMMGSRYLNSEAYSTSTGILARASIRYFPMSAGMPGGAAGGDDDPVDAIHVGGGQAEAAEVGGALVQVYASEEGVGQRIRAG